VSVIRFDGQPAAASATPAEAARVVATPFKLADPKAIPMREWLYGTALIRKFLSLVIAPGGVGKSSLTIVEALAMASGRPLLRVSPAQKLRVWLWNGEDPSDELARRITGACLFHGVQASELGDRLFVDTGRETPLVVMREVRRDIVVAEPVVQGIIGEIERQSDNSAVARVAYLWSSIADRTKCAIVLVHHARKTNGGEVTAEDARGASALVGAARLVRVLNPMTKEEAGLFGVNPDERFSYVRVSDGKANLARRLDRSTWFRLASVNLGNGTGNLRPGDDVAVVEAWEPSEQAQDALTPDRIAAVQAEVARVPCRLSVQSPQWIGNAVTRALDLNPEEAGVKKRVKWIVERLIEAGHLRVVEREDGARRMREFVEVGEPVEGP
jgi:hypothetical protein